MISYLDSSTQWCLDFTDEFILSPESIESGSLYAWLIWKTVPILTNLARPQMPSRRIGDSSKLSQSVSSESLWRHTSSRSQNTARKSSLSSSTNSSIRPIIETGSFLDQILNRLDDSTPNTNLWYKLPNKIKM